jgi:N-acetylglucosamine-6-sulfatase
MQSGYRWHGSAREIHPRFIALCSDAWVDQTYRNKHYGRVTEDMSEARAQGVTARPSIVFILADDLRKDDMKFLPKTHSLLREQGMGFRNAFVSHALCSPSRASIMRGQYSHNTGVWSNSSTDSPTTATGGWQAYKQNGNEADNVATRLHDAGYRTALFGKYLNG